ncbi:hypothetical protein ACT3TZ_14080 [Brachybacterium sp. AOP25-B2-12]|uniref:hypothetical protein n=1 Tax=Brachybacterium sp. AOP25-B2-12 TaxID=3457710 RepID=UPI0040348AE3
MNESNSGKISPGRPPIGPVVLGLALCYLPMWLTPVLGAAGLAAPMRGHLWAIVMNAAAVAML